MTRFADTTNRYKHLIIQLDIYKPRLLRLDLQMISENHNFMSKKFFVKIIVLKF